MVLRRSVARSMLAATLSAAAAARADDGDLARARALFDEAGRLELRGRWADAEERLRRAMRIRETPHLHYAVGWALENEDKLLEARREYERALHLAQKAGATDVAQLAAERLAQVERATPRIEVVGDGAADARIVVDGRAIRLGDGVTQIAVNPGSRVVVIERRGRAAVLRLVYVPREALRVIEVDGAPRPAPAALRDVSQEPRASRRRGLAIALTAGGSAFAVSGGALFASSASDAGESASTRQLIGGTAFGIGLLGAGLGIFLLTSREGKSDGRAPVASVSPVPGGAVAGAAVRF